MEKLKVLWRDFDRKTVKIPKLVIVLAFLVLILRLPSLFEPCWYGDEGIYLTLGQGMRRGQMLYRDLHDNKPPLLYLLAAVAGNVFWFRFILLLWMLATVWLFFKLAEEIFPKKKWLQSLLTVAFVILTSIPTLEGNIANAEIFFIGLIIAGFLAFLKKKHFWAGFLLGLSFLFKSPPLFDFGALLIFSLLTAFNQKDLKNSLKKVILPMAGGFLLPLFTTIIYYSSKGNLIYYIKSAFLLNLPYLSSWGSSQKSILINGLFPRGLILLVFLVLTFWQRKKLLRQPVILLVSLWLLLALFGALLSGRPYPHYLIQILAPFLILSGAMIVNLSFLIEEKRLFVLFLPIFLVPLAFRVYNFYTYRVLDYYQNFAEFTLGKKNQDEYYRWFDGRVAANYQLARFIRDTVPENERIFIWGNEPCVYALSRHLPVGRYAVAYHIIDFDGYEETMEAIKKNRPLLIIFAPFDRFFLDLNSFLEAGYLRGETVNKAQIWYRKQ